VKKIRGVPHAVVYCRRFHQKPAYGVDDDLGDRKETAFLILEDGTSYRGRHIGARKSTSGEVVFNTGMVGYPESLTDPSYHGQILSFTYPLLGNYGVPAFTKDRWGLYEHFESDRIHACGVICAEYSEEYSHWNSSRSLHQWLKDEGIVGITGIDTRELTQKLRAESTMLGKIIIDDDLPLDHNLFKENMVAQVSVKEPVIYGNGKLKILVVDCGIKQNIIRCLLEMGDVTLKVVPFDYPFAGEDWDGLFISNGPGDPRTVGSTINELRKAFDHDKPIFGICMGNQLMALAAGAACYKLPYGNRGQNQPVVDLSSGQVFITPQNHGYAVDNASLPADWKPSFLNANDGSNEGIMHRKKPFFSVQFHPEARSGPYDTRFMFKRFLDFVGESKIRPVSISMPRRLPKKVLILGSGALQIGQAGEFDYSGSQAIKALKEEGVSTVLINPNIATVQTAKGVADQIYFLPVTPEFVEKVIERERPDGILLGFGGQTGLNCGLELDRTGVLAKYGVSVLGTPTKTIEVAEDRELFNAALAEINQPVAPSVAVVDLDAAQAAAKKIGYPVIVRAAFALGGLGSGFADNEEELEELVVRALASSPQVLVEKSLKGWKEVEYEVVRDINDNCITVCNMENFDPMGIHTGESIVVAPSQTLSNQEYHMLREAAIAVVRHLGIVGECNIQYTLDPNSEVYYIIEVNPRLSRSSALASKATGYPLAFVAAKLSLGIPLPEIRNSVTKTTSACFEPSLDYVVTKIPRWDLDKFTRVKPQLSSQMKSVGEVMSIGRTWEESIQKALRTTHMGRNKGFELRPGAVKNLDEELRAPTPARIYAIAEALDKGYTLDQIYDLTKVDKWFLAKLQNIWDMRKFLMSKGNLAAITPAEMRRAKVMGFSDSYIGDFVNRKELEVRAYRKQFGILPVVKQIDTLAAEFPAKTNYLYMTYHDRVSDVTPSNDGAMVLGSGTYRIGSSVEFDYCAVSAARTLRKEGINCIMVNYNPETVSTDYDESDKLYFEELSLERVLDIYEFENPTGIIVSVGGQEAQNLALPLFKYGANVLGTSPLMIDRCEDRFKFSQLLDQFGVEQPAWKELSTMQKAAEFADEVSYPVLVRPSYVLSGAAMKVAYNERQLHEYLANAADVSPEHPVVMTKFLLGAKELELDAVAKDGVIINWAISEHIEDAGVHSGDATMLCPSDSVPLSISNRLREIGAVIASALQISGPMNVQYLWKGEDVLVIECNLRASRSFPFVSKVYDIDFIATATKIFLKRDHDMKPNPLCGRPLEYVGCKAPQFSFQRIHGADPVLGVEMASTGEVACFGRNKYEAFLKGYLSVPSNFKMPKVNDVIVSGNPPEEFGKTMLTLIDLGYKIHAQKHVIEPKFSHLLKSPAVHLIESEQHIIDAIKKKKVSIVFNFPDPDEDIINYQIRRLSVDFGIPLMNNLRVGAFMVESLKNLDSLKVEHYADYYSGIKDKNVLELPIKTKWRE